MPVEYKGDEEFEQFCDAFNEMQRSILESRRQQAKEEQDWYLHTAYEATKEMNILLKQYERLTRKQEKTDDGAEKIIIQNLVIEPGTWKVWKDGEELRLPNREFELLCFLAKHPNLVFSKEKLFEAVWGAGYRLNL